MSKAACAGSAHTEDFNPKKDPAFPSTAGRGGLERQAKAFIDKYCTGCPVTKECAAWGAQFETVGGIWGGQLVGVKPPQIRIAETVRCLQCRSEYQSTNPRQRYCGRLCRGRAYEERIRKPRQHVERELERILAPLTPDEIRSALKTLKEMGHVDGCVIRKLEERLVDAT